MLFVSLEIQQSVEDIWDFYVHFTDYVILLEIIRCQNFYERTGTTIAISSTITAKKKMSYSGPRLYFFYFMILQFVFNSFSIAPHFTSQVHCCSYSILVVFKLSLVNAEKRDENEIITKNHRKCENY